MPRPDPAVLASLRARIWAMERAAPAAAERLSIAPAIDAALPWGGLPLACLHQVIAEDATATGFCALLAGRLAGRGPALWCLGGGHEGEPYPPGLASFGLPPDRVLLARCPDGLGTLWAMEEGLRSGRLGAVIGETRCVEPTAARRLQLAAEAGGTAGFLLMPASGRNGGGATTRWRVGAAPGRPPPWDGLGTERWRIRLERCRGGSPRQWLAEWRPEDARLEVVTPH